MTQALHPGAELVRIGDAIGNTRLGDLSLGARDSLGDGCLSHKKSAGDLRRCQAAYHAKG